jgi:hypothetical protein
MATGPEIKTKITIDDAATATLKDIEKGFRDAGKEAEKTSTAATGFIKQFAAVALGVNIGNILGGIKSGLMSGFDAAVEADKEFRKLTQSVIGIQRYGKQSFDSLQERATLVKKAIESIADASQISRRELVDAFNDAAKNTSLTDTQLTKLMSRLADSSRALPAPIKETLAGFEELNKNMISASNPIVLMVKQAGLLRGHSERIAKEMEWMGKTRRIKYAEEALAILQDRAKKIPPSLADISARFDDMKTDALRSFGTPLLRAFLPALEGVYKKMTEGRGDIEAYARELGMQVGQWVTEAAQKIKDGFQYLRENGSEIKKNIVEAFTNARDIFTGIYNRAKEIATIYAAVKTSQIITPAAQAAGGLATAAVGRATAPLAVGGMNAALMPGMALGAGAAAAASGGALASIAAFVGPQGALAAMILSFLAAKDAVDDLSETMANETRRDLQSRMRFFDGIAQKFDTLSDSEIEAFERVKVAALENAEALGLNTSEITAQIDAQMLAHRNLEAATIGAQSAMEKMQGIQDKTALGGMSGLAAIEADRMKLEAAQQFAESFNSASEMNFQAAIAADAKMAMSSETMKQTLLTHGAAAGLALDKLADAVSSTDRAFARDLRLAALKAGEKGGKETRNLIFNGAQFTIKQDFRDQDPDRVAVVFQRDITRAAENRIMASTVRAFGG